MKIWFLVGLLLALPRAGFSKAEPLFPEPHLHWAEFARRLTGESESVRQRSLKHLSQVANLERKLREAFGGEDQALALDVISALKLRNFLPELVLRSAQDDTGSIYLTLNTLFNSSEAQGISRFYHYRLRTPQTPEAVKVILLDTLRRLRWNIPAAELRGYLFSEDHPEVRNAALSFLRAKLRDESQYSLLPLLAEVLRRRPLSWQSRVQALYLASEMPAPWLMSLSRDPQFPVLCPADIPVSLRARMASICRGQMPAVKLPLRGQVNPWDFLRVLFYSAPEQCAGQYRDFFRNPVVDARIVFGYKDGRPARFVGDRYERNTFVQSLGRWGFRRVPGDDDLFWLDVHAPRERRLMLRVVDASVSPDDDENRKNPFQAWRTENAEKVFFSGLRQANAVFYNGHSRDGGGPDFAPPRLQSDLHVDYGWYRHQRPGLKKLKAAGAGSDPGPQWLGFFSCASDLHFSNELKGLSKHTQILAQSTLLYYTEALREMENALKMILERRCLPGKSPETAARSRQRPPV